MIVYKKGDLLNASEDIIAHGCNCQGGFGSGVAGQIAKKYPLAKEGYLLKYAHEGWVLGDIQWNYQLDGKTIVNCATQESYLPRGIVHASYEAIWKCMLKLKHFAELNNKSIAIPKIGAGLAGGDWNIIEQIIKRVFKDYPITVYEL